MPGPFLEQLPALTNQNHNFGIRQIWPLDKRQPRIGYYCICRVPLLNQHPAPSTLHPASTKQEVGNRVGQNRIYMPYMTVYLVISCPKYRIYTVYIWFWPTLLLTLLLVTCPSQVASHCTFLLHICLHATTYNAPTCHMPVSGGPPLHLSIKHLFTRYNL